MFVFSKDVVRTLLEFEADLEKELNAGKEKKTPLAIAASLGNMDIVKLLVTNGAKVEARGKNDNKLMLRVF